MSHPHFTLERGTVSRDDLGRILGSYQVCETGEYGKISGRGSVTEVTG